MDDEPKSHQSHTDEPSAAGREETGPLRIAYCFTCAASVEPVGKGQCPKCRQFLPSNTVARKHIASVTRREQLHAENIAEYQPNTLQLRRACRWLANISERLEGVKDGTPEHQRLIAMWTELTATLEASRTARAVVPTDYSTMTKDQLVGRTEDLLARLKAHRDYAPPSTSDAPTASPFEVFQREAAAPAPVEASPPAAPTPEPPAQCPYCHSTPCIGRDHHAYDSLHENDPEHIERRRQHNTRVMLRTMRVGSGITRW